MASLTVRVESKRSHTLKDSCGFALPLCHRRKWTGLCSICHLRSQLSNVDHVPDPTCTLSPRSQSRTLVLYSPTRTCYLARSGWRHPWHIAWWIHVILLQVLICIQLLFLRLATLITARTAWRINVGRLSLSRNSNGETTVIMLLEMHFSPNNHHLPFSQVKHIRKLEKNDVIPEMHLGVILLLHFFFFFQEPFH